MKIAYIATTAHVGAEGGEGIGSSTHTLELAKAFKELGHEIFLVTARWEGDKGVETVEGVKVYRLYRAGIASGKKVKKGSFRGIAKIFRPLSNILAAFKCNELLRREGCDAVLERAQSRVGGVLAMLSRKPLYLEVIDNLFCPGSAHLSKKIFAYSGAFFGEEQLKKVVLVKAACNHAVFRPEKKEKLFDLCYVGSFKEWDGLEDLVEALAGSKTGKGLRVVLAGDGPRKKLIEGLCGKNGLENVVFAGRIPQKKAVELINSSRLCAAPYNVKRSHKGGFKKYGYYFSPLKVVEYMACARPVVATNYSLISEIVQDKNQLFPEGDAKALSQKINSLLARGSLGRIGQENLNKVCGLSWKSLAKTFLREMGAKA